MLVHEAMAHTVACARPDDDIGGVAELMRREGTGFIPVVDGDHLVGVVTDRDIVIRGIGEGRGDPRDLPAADVMTRELTTVQPDAPIEEAARLMVDAEVRRLPVTDHEGHLVGVLSHGNLVQGTAGGPPAMAATIGVTRGA
jgi:CBS domain-containing protein